MLPGSVFALEEDAGLGLPAICRLAAQLHAAPDLEIDGCLSRSGLVALLDRQIGTVVEILARRNRGAAIFVCSNVEIVDADRAAQLAEQRA